MLIPDPRQWLSYVPPTLGRISPLYDHLYRNIQDDPELFALLAFIDPDQPIPVLFLSVITFLALGNPQEEFAQFYPAVTFTPRMPSEAYPYFRAFCLAHLDELHALLPTARLQTNEVTRCANLLPAFHLVFERGDRHPLALLEIGASAGLNLNFDRYKYTYTQSHTVGDATSPVQITCTLEGERFPPIPVTMPPIGQRVGIEIAPLDINTERDVRWLRSCIWPEERERYHLLDAAITMAQQHPPHILAGDACNLLPHLLANVPSDHTICLWHSFALNQGTTDVRARVTQALMDASLHRTIYRISIEANPLKVGLPRLELSTYRKGDLFQYEWLAECDFHGERMEWLAPSF